MSTKPQSTTDRPDPPGTLEGASAGMAASMAAIAPTAGRIGAERVRHGKLEHVTEPNETRCTITGLVGVYNADGTIRGELAYWVGKRLGRAHCALCDITHGSVKERPEWKRCRDGLPVPFDTYHRDDQPESTRTHRSQPPGGHRGDRRRSGPAPRARRIGIHRRLT